MSVLESTADFLEVKTAIDSVIRDFARKEKLVSSIGIDTWGVMWHFL